jgi:hypothetical protein
MSFILKHAGWARFNMRSASLLAEARGEAMRSGRSAYNWEMFVYLTGVRFVAR